MNERNFNREVLSGASRFSREKEYWTDKLSCDLGTSHFPYEYDQNEGHGNKTGSEAPALVSLKFTVTGELFTRLVDISRHSDSRLFVLLVMGLSLLLQKYTGHEDIVIGAPIDRQNIEGDYINTILALRSQISTSMTIKEFLLQVRQTIVGACENQNYPLESFHYELNMPVNEDDNFLLFDHAILLENIHDKSYIDHLKLSMIFSFNRTGECLEGEVEYNPLLYRKESIERVIGHFTRLLGNAFDNPGARIADLEILGEKEKEYFVVEMNDTGAEYPRDTTIQKLFEMQVEKNPGNIAVEEADGHHSISYKELDERANQLASLLREKGVGRGTIVAIMGERTLEIVIGILAILKAGGGYLPIDAQNPDERIRYILSDSRVFVVLSQSKIIDQRRDVFREFLPGNVIPIDNRNIYPGKTANPGVRVHSSDLAYIIYTSGTTGKPKGVMIEHNSLVNYVHWAVKEYVKDDPVNFPFYTSIGFDLTITSIFTPLISGNSVIVYSGWNKGNLIERIVDDNNAGVIKLTPSHLHMIQDKKMDRSRCKIRRFVVGGEVLEYRLARDIYENAGGDIEIYNEYGPTEATVGCMLHKFDPARDGGRSVSIGNAAANTGIYLLDKDLHPVPPGAVGEIYVGGAGVARGYLNKVELTVEKFPVNPFVRGELMYKTGDMARWLVTGDIEFVGRIDHQVKIRGFRIELAEIESQLLQYKTVKKVVAAIKEAAGDNHICAYIVSGEEFSVSELREYLAGKLPDYMIPTYFVRIDDIPLTPNGKIDMNALPEPGIEVEIEYVAPRNETETKLQEIWSEILGLDAGLIGIDYNFFELGGHSLSGTVLTAKMHKTFDVKVALADLFRLPTVRELAQHLEESKKIEFTPLESVEEKEYYPLSSAQKRLYVLQELEMGNNINYNIPFAFTVEGKLDINKFTAVFKKLISRHESFRTSFEMMNGEPVQRIHRRHQDVGFNIENYELKDTNIQAVIKTFIRVFDLDKAPLFRVGTIKIDEDNHILMIDMPHIVSDGVSINVIMNDFSMLYHGKELPDLKIQYKDYSEWQNSEKQKKLLKDQEAYWLKKFDGEIPLLDLPTDYTRPAVQQFKGNVINFSIDEQLRDKIRELEKRSESTLFIILLAIFNTLLMRYSGQEDIVVGTLTMGRSHIELENIVGVLLNTLPIRSFPGKDKCFLDYISEVKNETLNAFENSDYQYDELVEKIRIDRNIGRNPLFDAMLILQNIERRKQTFEGMVLKDFDLERTIALLDLRLVADEIGDELTFSLEYSTSLFKTETIEQMIRHLIKIMREVTANPKRNILEYDLLGDEEKKQLLTEFNGVKMDFPGDRSILHYVEDRAEKTPDHIALVDDGNQITYRHLNRLSNRLARNSGKLGAHLDHYAIILLERSILMAVSIISVWKSGGAYIPIDIQYPAKRISGIIDDSRSDVVISDRRYVTPGVEKELKCKMIFPEEILFENGKAGDADNLNSHIDMNNLSYIIYTSGSTGKPKGVMIEHIGMMNHIHAKIHDLRLTGRSVIAQNASHTFDISVWQFFAAIAAGGKSIIFPDKTILDTGAFIKQIIGAGVTVLEVVPSYLSVLLDAMEGQFGLEPALEYLLVTGEVLKPVLVERWFEQFPGIRLVNAYGPTEASDDITHYIIDKNPHKDQVPIGRPLQNLNIYIVDERMNLVPIGVKGEICVSGVGVGKGYVNNEAKTKEVFMEDPFRTGEGVRLYKTGDLGRWLPDGVIEFHGRKDHQVKIRGYRIELEEIENVLTRYTKVKEAAAIDREVKGPGQQGIKILCAYLTGVDNGDIPGIKQRLSEHIPQYMIPTQFFVLDRLPLTGNGKVDRKKLPAPEGDFTGEYIGPRNRVEEKLVEIWADVLNEDKSKLSIDQDFFELGGHSLKAITLISKIHKEMDVRISLAEIFQHPSIRGIAENFIDVIEEKYIALEPVEKKDYYAVSSAQRRLYALQQLNISGTGYNLPVFIILEGTFDMHKMEATFHKLIERYESFRTSFELIEGEPVQKISGPGDIELELEFFDLSVESMEPTADELELEMRNFVRPFDLTKPPLLKVRLDKVGERKHILMVDMHHIISDGISHNILVENFVSLYNGADLPPLSFQYKEFAAWQNREKIKESLKKQEAYWLAVLGGELPSLDIPLDYPRPAIQDIEGDAIHFIIDNEKTDALKRIAAERGVTLYMVLLSIFNILLSKISGQEDIIIGTPVGGRRHADLEKIIGMFVNTMPLRNFPKKDISFADFLYDVKTGTIDAFDNQDYLFEDMVRKIGVRRDTSRNPIFDVLFSYLDFNPGTGDIPMDDKADLKYTWYQRERKTSKFDLTLEISVGSNLSCVFEYCTTLFKKEKIERFIKYWDEIISTVTGDENIPIMDIKISHELLETVFDIKEQEFADFGF